MTIETDADAFEEAMTLVERYRDALERIANRDCFPKTPETLAESVLHAGASPSNQPREDDHA